MADALAENAAATAARPARRQAGEPGPAPFRAGHRRGGARRWTSDYDAADGGFGGAPKFPPSMVLEFLLRHHAAHRVARPRCGWPRAPARRWPAAACTTSSAAGSPATRPTRPGWCRTSRRCSTTTPCWPGSTCTCGAPPAPSWPAGWPRRPAPGCCASCARPRAGSPPSLDADSEGEEGKFYVWTPAELDEVLGPRGRRVRGRRSSGSPRTAPSSTAPRSCSCAPTRDATPAAWPASGTRCWPPAAAGSAPGRDDKVVAAWNGLAISALAESGLLLDRPDFIDAARDGRRAAGRGAPGRRQAGPHLARRLGRGHRGRAGGLRLRRRGLPRPVRGDRRGALADPGRRAARHRAGRLRRRRRAASTTRRRTARR